MKLMCGDCLTLMQTIPENSIDATITSPPYDDLRTYEGKVKWGEEQWQSALRQLYRITKPGGVVVWIVNDASDNGSETGTSFKQALYAKEVGFNLHDTMIWNKQNGGFRNSKTRYIPSFDYMFVFSKGKPKTTNLLCDRRNKSCGDRTCGSFRKADGTTVRQVRKRVKEFGKRYNIWNISPFFDKRERTSHPAQFPIALARDHILSWTNEGDIVLDPFMGSGTTAIACAETRRHFIGMELNENYVAIAKLRLKDMKGGSNG